MERSEPNWGALGAGVLVAVGLVLLVYSYGWSTPFTSDDVRALELVAKAPWSVDSPRGLGFVAHASATLSAKVHGVDAAGWRIEALIWLVIGGLGWGVFTRRVLLPWTGSDHARFASVLAGILVVLHPLASTSVVQLAARGEQLAFCLMAWVGAWFLRGRQDRVPAWTALAVGLTVIAAATSASVLLLPALLWAVEVASAHRYRPWAGRVRTGLTTFAVFAAAVGLGLFVGANSAGASGEPFFGAFGRDVAPAPFAWLGALGRLVLPVADPLGALGTVGAGALFLFAVQPSASAARVAPRLWGWLLFGWFTALLAGALVASRTGLFTGGFELSWILLPATGFLCFGLAASVSAVSGVVRVVLSLLLVFGYAGLSIGTLRAHREAGEETAALLDAIGEQARDDRPLWVVDPPVRVNGSLATDHELSWAARFLGLEPDRIRAVSREALPYVTAPGANGLTLDALAWSGGWYARRVDLPAAEVATVVAETNFEGRTAELSIKSASARAIVLEVESTSKPESIELWFRAEGVVPTEASLGLVFWPAGGSWRTVVDLTESPEWWLAGRVRELVLTEGAGRVRSAVFLSKLPPALAAGETSLDGAVDPANPPGTSRELVLLSADRTRVFRREADDSRSVPSAFLDEGVEAFAELRLEGHTVARSKLPWPPSE